MDYGDTAMVEALLAAGANVAAKNKGGQTSLELARKYGHTAIAEIGRCPPGRVTASGVA